jgi:hypothetical protein
MIKFGFRKTQLAHLARDLEPRIGVRFEAHEADFRGGEYFRAETQQGTLILQTNYDLVAREPFEDDWPERQAVLYLDGLDDQVWKPFVERLEALGDELGATWLE